MEAYIGAKLNITKNQTAEDVCVLNYEDETTRKMAEKVNARVLFFASGHKLEQGFIWRMTPLSINREKTGKAFWYAAPESCSFWAFTIMRT